MSGFLRPSDVAAAQRDFHRLMDDVQALQNVPTITIRRGGATVLTVRPKSLRLDNQQADNGSANGPSSDVTQSGTVKIATTEYTADVRVGDRFVWQGQPCAVTTSPMAKPLTGMTEFAFELTARDRGVGVAGLTITWRPGPEALVAAILGKVAETESRLEGLAQTHAAAGQASMKQNAPWTDQTGAARAGLQGTAAGLAITLRSTVQPYGPYLENGTSKMDPRPIVQPTARQVAADYTADAVAAVKDIWS